MSATANTLDYDAVIEPLRPCAISLPADLTIHEFSAGYRKAASADFTSLWPAESSELELR